MRKGVREKARPGIKLRCCAQKREEPVVDQIPADVPVRVCQSERGVGAVAGIEIRNLDAIFRFGLSDLPDPVV